jgi:hypothetical protein
VGFEIAARRVLAAAARYLFKLSVGQFTIGRRNWRQNNNHVGSSRLDEPHSEALG